MTRWILYKPAPPVLKVLLFAAAVFTGSGYTHAADFFTSSIYQHRWNSIKQSVDKRFDSYYTFNPAAGFEEFFGQVPDESVTLDEIVTAESIPAKFRALLGQSSVWGNYAGRTGNLVSSSDLGGTVKTDSSGVQCGFDVAAFNGFVIGAMFGYEEHRSRLLGDWTAADDYYFGIYAAKQFFNGFDIRGAVGYGSQEYRNNAAITPGGRTLEANLEIGRRFYKGPNCSMRPFAAFDYLNNKMDAEDGLSRLKLEQGFIRFGTDSQFVNGPLSLAGFIAFSQNVLGNPLADWYGDSVFTFGVGGSYVLNARCNWTVFAGYETNIFVAGNGGPVHSYHVGTQLKF
ncbi:MAG: autotransporter outer membrane beta-barrel domain-containing protein [Planctomycetaceae bacterium]|jgi:hypothetical protein|nr:autotransporter outer membrane beta-barrel domain-containing protein [Planctomycetaceae bacterium]